MPEPLQRVTSLRSKLGVLVSVSVLVAAVLATLGAESVPAWLSIPVTVLLALGVTQWLARGMTAPLRQMTDAARRMAGGDYDTRVTTARDEVGELATAFTSMAADLRDVDRQRRELVASVSHELRTPLTALTALLENLHDGVTPADEATLAPALQQAQRLGALVEDLLDLSRVDAGVTPLRRRDVPLGPLLAEAAGEAGAVARAGSRDVALEVAVEPPGLSAHADPDRLHQVVANLLDNATRHSPAGGTVRLSARAHAGGVRIDVADDGPGIGPEDRDRVFERFGTGQGVTGGTGLGLAIARWVTDLHGGRIQVATPPDGRGALLRVDLPGPGSTGSPGGAPPVPSRPVPPTEERPVPPVPPSPLAPLAPPLDAAPAVRRTAADDVFGSWWADSLPGRPRVLLAGLGVGLLAAVAVPYAAIGLGATLVLLVAGALVWRVSARRRTPYVVASAVVCLGLALVPVLRDAEWIGVLGLLAAGVLVPTALTDARTVRGAVVAAMAWPLAGLRGMPWLGRSVRGLAGPGQGLAVVRTAVVSLVGVLVFGLLFASADAVFGRWFDALLPELGEGLVLRIFTGVAVGGIVLAAAYLAINPPPVDGAARPRDGRGRRYEWLVPLLLVDAVFVAFLVAQAAALAGGVDFVQRTTGLTYSDYAREGFGQLTVATALTLVVVALAGRRAGRGDVDRAWLRAGGGLLGVLTLLVVASAMTRMWLYTDAYGLTRLRLVVWVFEGWLALVVVGLLVAGVRLRAAWVPRAAVLGGAAALLALAAVNPDGVVARVNLERYEASGDVDWYYLSQLSDDALPVLAQLPDARLACALPDLALSTASTTVVASPRSEVLERDEDGGLWAWNLGRVRAESLLAGRPLPVGVDCAD